MVPVLGEQDRHWDSSFLELVCWFHFTVYVEIEKNPSTHIYINKDGNPFTISTRHVEANVNTGEENQNNQNSSNEVEDLMLNEMGTATVLIYFQNQRFFKKYITAQHSSKNANNKQKRNGSPSPNDYWCLQ